MKIIKFLNMGKKVKNWLSSNLKIFGLYIFSPIMQKNLLAIYKRFNVALFEYF